MWLMDEVTLRSLAEQPGTCQAIKSLVRSGSRATPS